MQVPVDAQQKATSQFLKRSVIFFCFVTFFFWIANYLFQPILSVYTQSLGADLAMVGTIVAAYGLPQLIVRIPMGVAFDITSKKKLFIISGMIATAVGALGLGLAPNFGLLFLARIITGIGAAYWVVITVYFISYYPPAGVRKAISTINFVQGAGVVCATLSGGFIAQAYGYKPTFWVAAAFGVLAIIILFFTRQPVVARQESFSFKSFGSVARSPLLIVTSVMGLLLQFANWSGLFGFTPVYAAQIGASKADLGLITMLATGTSALIALAVPRMMRGRGASITLIVGAFLLAASIAVVPFVKSVSVLEVTMAINGVGRGILTTTFMMLCVQSASPGQRATAMGIYQASYALGMFLGPELSGLAANGWGLSAVFYLSAALSVGIGIVSLLPAVRKVKA
jgi:predicted MFS family arabinose efflux permease